MSQLEYQPYTQTQQTNGLGLAGFICSLVGILTAGVLCPIGLILSLVALGRRPRGFAIAGVVIGLLGSCGALLVIILLPAMVLAILGIAAASVVLQQPEQLEITSDMVNTAIAIQQYKEKNHVPPASLTLLHLQDSTLNDPWGNPYKYELQNEPPGYDLVSSGKDKAFNTLDDVRLTKLGEAWEASTHATLAAHGDGKGGNVRIGIGDKGITATGDQKGGTVTIDLGGRVIEITGDDTGGSITTNDAPPDAPVPPATTGPDTP